MVVILYNSKRVEHKRIYDKQEKTMMAINLSISLTLSVSNIKLHKSATGQGMR